MKTGFAVLTGLLVAEGVAGGINLDVGSCQTEKNLEVDTFYCPCSGGSGDYDYHYSDLPEDWTYKSNKIIAPKGKI